MTIFALYPAKVDSLSNILGHPEAWEAETKDTHSTLKELTLNTSIQENQLMKTFNSKLLIYILLSQRVYLLLQAHCTTEHDGVLKNYNPLAKH